MHLHYYLVHVVLRLYEFYVYKHDAESASLVDPKVEYLVISKDATHRPGAVGKALELVWKCD